jgi:hypothetical protein
MLLEVASEERLVGKAVSVGYFLQRQFGRLQRYFQFQNQVPVNDALGCLSSYLPGNGSTGCCQFGNGIVSVNAGMRVAGIFFQKVDKGWWQPEAGVLKPVEAAAEVVQAKVIAGFFYKEYAAGYQDDACILANKVMVQIYGNVSVPFATK